MKSSDLGVLDGRLFLGDDDFVVWNCKTEGHGIFDGKLHFHDFYEMSFIYSGSGSYEVNGRRFPVERGFWLLSTPSDCHRLSVSPGECLRYYNVIFRENQIAREISDRLYRLTLPLCLTLPGEAPPLSEDFARLLADYFVYAEKGDELSRRLVKNQVENLCLRFVVLLKQLPAPAAVNFPPTAHRSKAAEPSKPIKSTTVTDSRESTDAKKSTFPVKSTASAETPVSMASPTSMGAGDEPPAACRCRPPCPWGKRMRSCERPCCSSGKITVLPCPSPGSPMRLSFPPATFPPISNAP